MKEISTNKAPLAVGPYSQAVFSNNIMYISGQIPINPLTNEFIKLGKMMGISIIDHIIIGKEDFYSLRQNNSEIFK